MTTSPSWLLSLFVLLAFFMTTEAHMAVLYPPCRGGVGTKDFDWRIHQFVGYEDYKFPCGGYPKGPNTGKCLFSWSWTANLAPQFYHNCADVTIKGVKDGKLPAKTIQIYDFKGHKQGKTFAGDGKSHSHGPGPIKSEIEANLE